MNLAQLESDLQAAKDAARGLIDATAMTCRDHVVRPATGSDPAQTGRAMTAEERGAIEAKLAICAGIQTRIDSMRSDAALIARVDDLTGRRSDRPSDSGGGARPGPRLSIGSQFVGSAEFRSFIKAQGHRRAGAWSSPTFESADGILILGATLTGDPASGGSLVPPDRQDGLLELRTRRTVVADLIAPGTTDSNLVQYTKEKTFTNAADAVKEGTAKPESAITFESASAPVRKIAHWIPVSEEMLEDNAQTKSIIDARLTLGLMLKEEDELLNGSGVDPHLLGLNTLPGLTPVQPLGSDTIADAMLKQITKIATTTYIYPDGWVMNPADWLTVQIAKNQQGNYMGSGPYAPPQTPMLWGLSGAVTPAEAAGEALVGAFRAAAQIFRRGGIRIEATNSHQDFFVKNLVAIRGEERLALAVYREAAFGKVDFVP
jgi:HK97 family phage major capsid protein